MIISALKLRSLSETLFVFCKHQELIFCFDFRNDSIEWITSKSMLYTEQDNGLIRHYQNTPPLSLVLICRRPAWDIAAGTAWDNCGICEHLSPTHNLSQAFTTELPAKLS